MQMVWGDWVGLVALMTVAIATRAAAANRTNFVVLFLDDAGWGDFGCNDPSVTETPNIDRLANDGMRFTDFHAAASVCTPSRAGLLTGRLGLRTGVVTNFSPSSLYGIAPGELTIADVLGQHGYDTHMIGKWHLGHHADFHPTYRGFGSWLGLPYSGDMGCLDSTPQSCKPSYDRQTGQPACPALCPPDNATHADSPAIPLYDAKGVNCSGLPCSKTIAQQPFDPFALNTHYADRASSIINSYAGSDRPFFLYVAFAHTHTPLAYSAPFQNASHRPGRASIFGNTLAEVDHSVGVIRKAIEDAGLGEDTLVLVAADNGPADLQSVACEAIGSPGPFVGGWQKLPTGGQGGSTLKTTVWEGGHRVVGIAWWPSRVPAGVTSHAVASTLDYMPTLASVANVPLPKDRSFDGVDLSNVLFHNASLPNRVLFHPDDSGTLQAMRIGQYKAFFRTAGAGPCRRDNGTHAPSGKAFDHDPPLVFDLLADPSESVPFKADTKLLQQFKQERDAKMQDIASTKKSASNYTQGGKEAWPCCSEASSCCRCKNNPPSLHNPLL